MPGGRRKWGASASNWRLHWVEKEGGVFKVEQEGDGLTDAAMEEWGAWMDSQIERRFGSDENTPELTASTLNFSRNELGDDGVRSVVEYLRQRKIAVQMVKFFKNNIGDVGAWAIGQLLAVAREPVHEAHGLTSCAPLRRFTSATIASQSRVPAPSLRRLRAVSATRTTWTDREGETQMA
mmetsp:Transcript_95843/g.310637  ORF Transcript_95843/g.310637 Transcript_95843/m.310637 type:complete len:180 (+) Transcript_95843:84-623(+)